MESTATESINAVHQKNVYHGLENDVLSMAASDAALELSSAPASFKNTREYSADRLAALLSACSSALRRERNSGAPTRFGNLLQYFWMVR